MLAERGGGYGTSGIPDTLQALIAARIDQLPAAEKALLHRAAVIGRIFWHGAITHVAPDLDVDSLLDDLLLRDFVLAEPRSTIIGEKAFRFKHMLIREVAYSGLAKAERAELHGRFADWLRERAGDELLEIRAYHLDHAAQLLVELDGATPPGLAHEAAVALEEAGRRSLARESNRAGRKLLLRAVELEPTLDRRYQAARAAWRLSDLPAVSVEMDRVLDEARAEGDTLIEGKALTALAEVALLREAEPAKSDGTDRRSARGAAVGGAVHCAGGACADRVVGRRLRHPGAGRGRGAGDRAPARAQGPRVARAQRPRQGLPPPAAPRRGGGAAHTRTGAGRGERQHRRACRGAALARHAEARPRRIGRGRAHARRGAERCSPRSAATGCSGGR